MAVDEEGINADAADHKAQRLIYVTPSHQYPTGAVMSLPRPTAVMAARQHRAWITGRRLRQRIPFQRPPDLQPRRAGHGQPRALHGHLPGIPRHQAGLSGGAQTAGFRLQQAHYDLQPPGADAHAGGVAEIHRNGAFQQRAAPRPPNYAERRQCLLEALKPVLGNDDRPPRISGAGKACLCLRLPNSTDDQAISRSLARQGLTRVRPLSLLRAARRPYCRPGHRLRLRPAGRHPTRRPADRAGSGPRSLMHASPPEAMEQAPRPDEEIRIHVAPQQLWDNP
ncbi:MAG: hypothetical protein R3E42_11670 [Burkholderiaceae bacterium]